MTVPRRKFVGKVARTPKEEADWRMNCLARKARNGLDSRLHGNDW